MAYYYAVTTPVFLPSGDDQSSCIAIQVLPFKPAENAEIIV